jgi:ubiquinone/menaquinone biosynthesis C-methylase UbiE
VGLKTIGGKPTGILGRVLGLAMNRSQTPVYVQYAVSRLPANGSAILDIGCGGGRFTKCLHDMNHSFALVGIDHSLDMVKLARRINKSGDDAKTNRPKILHGTADEIRLDSNSVDLITAFETVQFWSDLEKALTEILRVLKDTGRLLIINRYPEEGSKWWRIARIKNGRDYTERLSKAGFHDISIDLEYKKGWIVVTAVKKTDEKFS